MLVYLASPNTQQQAEHVENMPVLLSFACWSKWLDSYQASFSRLLIDSGAYSEMTTGKKVDGAAYKDWCHGNGNRADNAISNLRWDTPAKNASDREGHGTTAKGSRCGQSKIDEEQAMLIRELRSGGQTLQGIGDLFGITKQAVQAIVRRKTWNHV